VLLDDPMSALDGHVGHAVFDQVLAEIHLLMHTTHSNIASRSHTKIEAREGLGFRV
jgi:ABC-type sulfate/molybdate transport systems ATPase subunit